MFVLVNGFDEQSLKRAYEVTEKLSHLSSIESVLFDLSDIDPKSKAYLEDNWVYLNDFNTSVLRPKEVEEKLKTLAQSILQSGAYNQRRLRKKL